MSEAIETLDLSGLFCPYPVVCVIRAVETMQSGQTRHFLIDDPLAVKSIPEELENLGVQEISIEDHPAGWEVTVTKY